MRLATIVAELNEVEMVGLNGSPSFSDLEITDVNFDSRHVQAGSLFCCVPGVADDGHLHAGDAVAAGAVALLVDHRVDVEVPQLVVSNVREAMATVSATCFGHPAEDLLVVGVTGTNGKTTTTWMLRNIFTAARRNVEVLGTLSGARTTPESPDLQRRLAEWRDEGVEVVAMEVSSHAIDQRRVDAMKFRVALFTNLSRDHLDYHGSMEEYFETKARLFDPERCESAVVNLDSPHGRLLADAATVPTDGYSLDEVEDLHLSVDGSTFRWMGHQISLPLGGLFNVSNALGAAHVARVLGIDDATIAEGLSLPLVVEGRFERVDAGQPFAIIVDYAHTPDAVGNVLATARAFTEGKVIALLGCGGDRDASKRLLMGRALSEGASIAIFTSDNPRSENPRHILTQMTSELAVNQPSAVIEDRAEAISYAVSLCGPGDTLLILGKGHEVGQEIAGKKIDFDDRIVLAQAIEALR